MWKRYKNQKHTTYLTVSSSSQNAEADRWDRLQPPRDQTDRLSGYRKWMDGKCRSSVWKSKSTPTASTGIKMVTSSQELLINALNWSSVSVSSSKKAEVLSFCWSGAFRCVLTRCQGGKRAAMTLEQQLLLPINLGRVIRPFPNYLECIILQRERLFTSGKH